MVDLVQVEREARAVLDAEQHTAAVQAAVLRRRINGEPTQELASAQIITLAA